MLEQIIVTISFLFGVILGSLFMSHALTRSYDAGYRDGEGKRSK